jgi:YHS domain-containing protein
MSKRSVGLGSLIVVVSLRFGVFVLVTGCQKAKPTAAGQQTQPMEKMPAHEHASMDQAQAKAVVAEQTTCPVMGGPIDKTIFTEYKGKKVYFCCKGCVETFKADPEKYIAKLPQFQGSPTGQ